MFDKIAERLRKIRDTTTHPLERRIMSWLIGEGPHVSRRYQRKYDCLKATRKTHSKKLRGIKRLH